MRAILLAASALAVAAAGAAYSRVSRKRLAHRLLPRYFLLKAFSDHLPELTSIYGAEEEWESFSQKILKCLREIGGAVGITVDDQEPQPAQIELGNCENRELHPTIGWNVKRRVHRVSDVVDSSLVPYLQSQKEVATLLRDYLPKSHQSWEAFIDAKLEDREKDFFDLNRADANADDELEALKACTSLVIQFMSEIQTISKAIEGATRGWRDDFPVARRKWHPVLYTEVKVFYATDRKVTQDAEYIGERSVDRKGTGLHYGLMVVGIPDVHSPGYLESPTRDSEEADPLKHVVILSIDTTLRGNTMRFIQKIDQELSQEGSGFEQNILLYIHGYNVHHRDAIKRAAQLKYDLQLKGVVVVYSWPSKGTLWGYPHDEEMVTRTADCLKAFIMTILLDVGSDAKVHILAHSMGSRALIKALQGFQHAFDGSTSSGMLSNEVHTKANDIVKWGDACPRQIRTLRNVIFAAADETCTKFEGMLSSLCTGSKGPVDPPQITVYSSICDVALHTSKLIHWKQRLGDTRSFAGMPYHGDHSSINPPDVIDASGVDVSKLHHSYYGDVPDVIKDIRDALVPFPAKRRARWPNALIHPVNYKNNLFYAFKPARLQKEFQGLTVVAAT